MVSRRYARKSRNNGQEQRKPKRRVRPFLFFFILTLVLLVIADTRFRPAIAQALRYQGKAAAARILAEETLNTINPLHITYDSISKVSRDNNGKITAIETDVTKLNQIKSLLEKNVTAALKKNGAEEEKIPLGTCLLYTSEMLEPGRVSRIAGDGNVDLFHLHNRNAFQNVVCPVNTDSRLLAF